MDPMAATEFLARSTALTSLFWVAYIIIGAVVGFVATKVHQGAGPRTLINVAVGVVGALIGGVGLIAVFGSAPSAGWRFTSLFTAISGSLILLGLVGLLRRN